MRVELKQISGVSRYRYKLPSEYKFKDGSLRICNGV